MLATLNHTGFCRQTLVGGNYGLLNRTTREPNADFFMAQMFHDTMGEKVLNLSASEHSAGLRTYAHCQDGGSGAATLLLINVSPTVTFEASLPAELGAAPGTAAGMQVFEFGVGDGTKPGWLGLDSQHITLNGELLHSDKSQPGTLPKISPRPLDGTTLTIKPLTISFITVPRAQACSGV